MSSKHRGGTIYIKADGKRYDAKGDFTYNLGLPTREGIVGADGMHGYKTTHKPGFIEGAVTDSSDLDLDKLQTLEDATVTLELANGKVVVCREAYYAHEGNVTTGEGEIPVRFEGIVEEVK